MAVTAPIWKDTYYESSNDSLVYNIYLGDEIIYSGKAFKYPNAETLYINVNKVCENYLSNSIEDLLGSTASSSSATETYKTFVLKDAEETTLETYNFLYDWSYEDWYGGSKVLSEPINGHYAANMYKFKTVFSGSTVTNYKYDTTLYTKLSCGDYALYYLDRAGGFSSYLIEGAVTKKEKITTHSVDSSFNNTSFEFESRKYAEEIETSYVMNTQYMSDEESERLAKNLIPSLCVYIHNLKTNKIVPAVITDTSVDYQTYQTNGKKMAQYKINIKESQSKLLK